MKLLVLLLAAFGLHAQITGKITDPFGAPLPGATVAAKTASGEERKSQTTASGDYQLDLPPGQYQLSVSMMTMKPFTKSAILKANEPLRLDVILQDMDTLGTLGDGDRFSAAFYNSFPKTPLPEGPVPRLPNGKPDLSGYWAASAMTPSILTVPVRAWVAKIREERRASEQRDNPYGFCLPLSVIMSSGGGKFVHTPNYLVILSSGEPARQIFIDGRSHPTGLNPTWQGHSIGHWEGETLVIDTIGFNGLSWIAGGFPSTEQLHLIERYTRRDLGHMDVEITIDDPPALERPWSAKRTSTLSPSPDIDEYICENNKDAQHLR